MYEQFFGLNERPFSLTPDTGFFYRYSGHQEALNVLLVALRNGEGFVRVIGEVGTGKTLLCRQLLKLLQDDCSTVYLPNPLLTQHELYQAIASELQLNITGEETVQQLNQLILKELIQRREQNKPVVILIDEAQAMPWQSLEALRLLSNLETEKEKLLHILFFAQPEFEQRLAEPELRQLRQRIAFSYQLPSLQQREVGGYLEHRLRVAGSSQPVMFQPGAVKLLARGSRGVPRLINLLAHKAMLAAYGKGLRRIDKRLMRAAIRDTAGEATIPGWRFATQLWRVAAVVGVAAGTIILLRVLL